MGSTDLDKLDTEDRQPGLEHRMDPAPDYMPRYAGSQRLAGKVAIVTGGDSGIGRATSILFAREGADVAIAYLDEHEDAELTKARVEAEGARALLLPGDVGRKEFCAEIIEKTLAAFGAIDIVVTNAAEQHARKEVTEISEDQLFRTFRTNLAGQFFLIQEALPHLKRGASIICTTSGRASAGSISHFVERIGRVTAAITEPTGSGRAGCFASRS